MANSETSAVAWQVDSSRSDKGDPARRYLAQVSSCRTQRRARRMAESLECFMIASRGGTDGDG